MIPRTLVPPGARLPDNGVPSTRRRPTTLDERTLVPSALPLVELDGRTTIPANLPLESIATRMVVPRDINVELVQRPEESILPPQPTDMDERITIPVGAAPPEELPPLPPVSEDLVEPNVISTGEVSFLPPEERFARTLEDRATNIVSVVVHVLLVAFLLFSPKIFTHVPTREENELARRQMTVLLPPGALEALKPSVPPAPHAPVKVDPRVINKIAPPAPTPPPPPVPEPPKRELPSAPAPQPNIAQMPSPNPSPSRGDLPKPQVKLENPDMPVPEKGLILPKNGSAGSSIQDALRGIKPNAPVATGGGIPVAGGTGRVGRGGGGSVGGGITMLTDDEGIDFHDYFNRIYWIVYNNWVAVMPPSVSLGEQGKLALHVKIMRDGSVPGVEPVLIYSSGKEPLDRAAISSIRSSNPFPPLPSQFKGPYIEIVYSYYYNLQPPTQ